MTSETRSRDRSISFNGPGSKTYQHYYGWNDSSWEQSYPTSNHQIGSETCHDYIQVTGEYEPHNLIIRKVYGTQSRLNGSFTRFAGTSRYTTVFDGWIPGSNAAKLTSMPTLSESNLSSFGNRILSGLSVNRPAVDLPLFLFELKDMPRMIRDIGRAYRRDIDISDLPGGFLSYRFGWAPLISDLLKLLEFGKEMENRLNFLLNISDGKRIRRTLVNEEPWISPVITHEPNLYYFETTFEASRRVWYTLRVNHIQQDVVDELTILYRKARSGNAESMSALLRRLLGLNLDRRSWVTLWNSLPWSWLIDYFFSIGNFLEAMTGTIPFSPTECCVMEHIHIKSSTQILREVIPPTWEFDNSVSLVSDSRKRDTKRRNVVGTPKAGIHWEPILTGGQTAILASLVTASGLRTIGR